MELLQLKYFCAVADCENITHTAARFGVPPSAVSQSIKRLEGELGAALFRRRANRILLTEEGRGFHTRVKAALALLEEGVLALGDREDQGRLRVCINANRRIVTRAIEGYRRLYPEVELTVTHLAPPDATRYDLIVEGEGVEVTGCDRTLLVEEELLLAVPADSPYVGAVSLSELSEAPFITMGERSGLFHRTHELCRAHGFRPHIAIQSDDPHYVRRCVELGLGVTLAPAFSWHGQFSASVVLRPIGGYTRKTYLYTPHGYRPLALRPFTEMLLAAARQE